MKKYTILHTIETAGPGGAETVVLELATGLDPRRFRSIALLPYESWLEKKLQARGLRTYVAQSARWYDFRLPRVLAQIIRQEQVDLVHSHLPDQNFYSCLAGRMAGCKTVVTYHGPLELRQAGQLKPAIKLWIVRNSAAVVVVVCNFVGEMLKELGFPAQKIVRIYNGIDLERLDQAADGQLRKELGLQNGSKLVGMVANVRQTKGYEYFIRAAKKVCVACPQTHFVAVGDIDQQIATPLWRLLDELSLRDRIHFLGFREDVPAILKDLDVFVLSSTSEGLPLVTLEAMGSAKPVVVTRCGGPQEVVEDGTTGYLVPPADADTLAERISELLAAPEHAAALGRSARAKIEDEFSISRMIASYEQLYERLLGNA